MQTIIGSLAIVIVIAVFLLFVYYSKHENQTPDIAPRIQRLDDSQRARVSSPLHENKADEKNYDSMIRQISEWSKIPVVKLKSMEALELHAIAMRWQAATLGTTEQHVRSMSREQNLDANLRQMGTKYGLTYDEMKRASAIEDKMHANIPLTSDENEFVRSLATKLQRR